VHNEKKGHLLIIRNACRSDAGRRGQWPEAGSVSAGSRRMGDTVTDTDRSRGGPSRLVVQEPFEACYCIEGPGVGVIRDRRTEHGDRAGTIYALGPARCARPRRTRPGSEAGLACSRRPLTATRRIPPPRVRHSFHRYTNKPRSEDGVTTTQGEWTNEQRRFACPSIS